MRRKRTMEDWILDILITAILLIIVFITLYPFYYILIITFNSGSDSNLGGMYLWPREFTLGNYIYFIEDPKWVNAFLVSILRTIVGTVLAVFFTSMVAYGLAKRDLMFRKTYFFIVVVAMNFSGGLIAFYIVLKSLGLINTFGVYVIPSMLNLFFLLIAISFFREIPDELGESARIDGASELRIFFSIVVPVSMPLMATMSLFIGSGQWNSWLDSAYFVQNENLRTLTYRMMQVINQSMVPTGDAAAASMSRAKVTPFSIQATAMVVSIIPILGVYPFLQKYFVSGMMLGSVKG
ncbi:MULTISPECIES: carbohydrate ABC transporter permease [Paenibacillus]|uniref:carbohydrate ABC transporter permease n=1 Tax=Paenibacillus TaxID=44249 RepID=UPI0005734320|nr:MULTISPECIES: carbohydrate ABC transporter permease [Paenibacillus]KHL97175.1 ABC transporter permease [Paenibacillus sp. IHB B 3415]OZQ77352.1 ABC transporter permease [Paenibacillus odorifer]